MRRNSVLLLCLIVLMVLLTSNAFAQNRTEYLQSRILAGFDNPQETDFVGRSFNWTVRANGGRVINGIQDPDPEFNLVEVYPGALYNRSNPLPEGARALGIRASFNRQGFNSLEIIPTDNDENPVGVAIPGEAQTIDFWVWGSNRDYYMEAHLRDYRGVDHVIRMGDIAFRGWRNLQALVPSVIPQRSDDPLAEGLRLTKLVLWTVPSERVDEFFVYIDELKISTDVFAERYDGDELADPDNVNALWNQGAGQ